jgi:hypothetical protein
MATKKIKPTWTVDQALETWIGLNEVLKTCTEDEAKELMTAEQGGKARPQFVKRIHSRLNRLRYQRERKELAHE